VSLRRCNLIGAANHGIAVFGTRHPHRIHHCSRGHLSEVRLSERDPRRATPALPSAGESFDGGGGASPPAGDLFGEGGVATIDECTVTGNGGNGILIRDGANAVIRGSQVRCGLITLTQVLFHASKRA
jgi:hypothetical protein